MAGNSGVVVGNSGISEYPVRDSDMIIYDTDCLMPAVCFANWYSLCRFFVPFQFFTPRIFDIVQLGICINVSVLFASYLLVIEEFSSTFEDLE